MPFKDARTLITSPTSGPQHLRRGIGHFTRSGFKDAEDDFHLGNWDASGNQ